MHRTLLSLALFGACTPAAPEPTPTVDAAPAAVPPPEVGVAPTRFVMRDVELVMPDGLLRVRHLEGTVVSVVAGLPPAIDKPDAYEIHVEQAEVGVDIATLNGLMSASHSRSGAKTPLASADFSTEGDLLVITGARPVPFVLKTSVSVDPQGRLTLAVVDLKALGIQTKGILDVLKLKLEDLVDVSNERGVTIDGDVIFVDPLTSMPAPRLTAKITGVNVEPDGLVLRLGATGTTNPQDPAQTSARDAADTDGSSLNFLHYSGGTVSQGNLVLHETDLWLVDLDPEDPLRIDIAAIPAQVAAGYTKSAANGQMTTFIPDANQIDAEVVVCER